MALYSLPCQSKHLPSAVIMVCSCAFPPRPLMNLFFEREAPKRDLRVPQPSVLPCDADLTVSALYRGSRIGGDFYEFVPLSDTRMVFLLTDIAGKRDEALHIAAAVQDLVRQ